MNDTRIHYLDGLRGVLALIVFTHHFLYIFYPELMLGGPAEDFMKPGFSFWKIIALTPLNIIFNPTMAINFFFLLSGYVQSFHYLRNPDLKLLQVSFVKRYFRLAIPTVAVVVLIYIFHRLHFIHKELLPANPVSEGWVKNQLPDNLNFLEALKFGAFDCFQGARSYYQVLWTMAVELLNSWMVLLLLFATHGVVKHKNTILLFWILVQIFLLKSTNSISFTAGMLFCSLHLHSKIYNRVFSHPLIKYTCLLAGLYLASFPIMEYEGSLSRSIYRPILFIGNEVLPYLLGNLFLFCFLLQATHVKHLFTKNIFQFYGSISFMVYLVHFVLLFSFAPKLYFILRENIGLAGNLIITFIATFGIVTAISFVLYKFIDKPGLKLSTQYIKKLLGA